MKYKAYLFDFDGTLVDSMPSYSAVMLRILDENGIPYGSDLVKTITPLGSLGTARYYRELGLVMSEEEIMALMGRYLYDEYALRIPAKAGVIETLHRLKFFGADLNILTASPHAVLDVCLSRLGITDLFTNIWSCDDFGTSKADPEIYKRAADIIGLPVGEILFLDDNLNANKTGREAGIALCAVYDPSSEEYSDEIKAVADYYIDDFGELLSL